MLRAFVLIYLIFISFSLSAQELFPTTEPASNVPKGALGIRLFDQHTSYKL